MFMADTMKAHDLEYELVNFDFSITFRKKEYDINSIYALPFTAACYKGDLIAQVEVAPLAAAIMYSGVDQVLNLAVKAEGEAAAKQTKIGEIGLDSFESYPTLDEIDRWTKSTIDGVYDVSTDLAVRTIVRDSTIATPGEWASILYLMHIYSGKFTPVVFTPMVGFVGQLYAGKRMYDLYDIGAFN
jgi:hypothetical protein